MMERVAVGRTAGEIDQAVGVRSRRERQRHKKSRGQLVGITGYSVQADGGRVWQGGAGGGARVVGGVDRTNSRGDRVEEEGQEAMAGDGAINSEEGMEQGLGARQGV